MENSDYKLKTVFVSGDLGVIAIAESLLNSAGIEYFVESEIFQSILGVGIQSGLFTKNGTAAKIKVKPEDEETARELLKDLMNNE